MQVKKKKKSWAHDRKWVIKHAESFELVLKEQTSFKKMYVYRFVKAKEFKLLVIISNFGS